MLRPQDGATRERRRVGRLWLFRLDAAGAGRAEGWWKGTLADARQIPVPASYNDVFADASTRDHVAPTPASAQPRPAGCSPACWPDSR
jgi:beta-glucuronidase